MGEKELLQKWEEAYKKGLLSFWILLLLADRPMYPFEMRSLLEEISQGTVKIGPGTLYGAFSTLEKEGLISMVQEDKRRKSYLLTPKGKAVLLMQIQRLEIMTHNGRLQAGKIS